jgi:hypothetical protein
MSAFKMISSVGFLKLLANNTEASDWILKELQLTQEEFNEHTFNEACFILDTYLKDKRYVSNSSAFWWWWNFLINSIAYIMEKKCNEEKDFREDWKSQSKYSKIRTFFTNVIEVQGPKFLFTKEDFKKMYSQSKYATLKENKPPRKPRTPKAKNN